MSIDNKRSDTHEEMFFHLSASDKVLTKNPNLTHATVFCRKESDGRWWVSVSYCHKSDHFCKSRGRSVARRKYFQEDRENRFIFSSKPTFEVARDIADEYLK